MTVRVGVVGGGLVAQAMHLPHLASRPDRFDLAALAEPSATVREALARRYSIRSAHADHRALLDGEELDAVLVLTPPPSHAEIVLAALDAGLHVFVEKPLCITLADADAIVAARDRAGKVVQVGYMKRFDPAYEQLVAELPPSTDRLLHVDVATHDPEAAPYFVAGELVRGNDLPESVREQARRREDEQLEAALGSFSERDRFPFLEGYLSSLVHDVNVVHGLLERMGEPLPSTAVGGAWWADGSVCTGSALLSNGGRWDSRWLALVAIPDYRETVTLAFEDSVRSLVFPSPWLRQSPTAYARLDADEGGRVERVFHGYAESFERELAHFHACVTEGASCRTPPEQARVDLDVLTRMFLAGRESQ